MSRRRSAIAWGLAAVAVYAATATLSGHLSVLARRPLLDGLAPPTPYRWVDPPPELEAANEPPAAESFDVALARGGSETAVLTTEDAQVSLVLPEGAFEAAGDQTGVEVTVEPLAPAAVSSPAGRREILGNVYRLGAEYVPSGDEAGLALVARVVLVYPLVANDHGAHALLTSPDGDAWLAVDTNDLPSIQQVDGPIDDLGYVAASRDPTAAPPGDDDGPPLVTIVAVGAGIVLLAVGVAVLLWPERRGTSGSPGTRGRDRRRRGRLSRPGRGAARGSRRSR